VRNGSLADRKTGINSAKLLAATPPSLLEIMKVLYLT